MSDGAVEDAGVIADPRTVTPAWLQGLLARRRSHGEPAPRVESIEVEPIDAENSRVARLRVRYRDPTAPAVRGLERLLLKTCPRGHDFVARAEIDYYERDYVGLERAPLVPCVGGGTDGPGDAAGYFVVLVDLGERYRDNRRVRPGVEHARALGEALARLHAHRWHDDDVGREPSALLDAFERDVEHARGGLEPVRAALADAATGERASWLDDAFGTELEALRARVAEGRGVTRLHGDANPTNVLTPIAGVTFPPPGALPLYLIDHQPFRHSPRAGLAALDLVRAAVPYWKPEERRALEPVLLRAYHEALRDAGVTDFDFPRLLEDYRLCLVHAVHVGVEWGTDADGLASMRWLWEAQLERARCAMRDWSSGRRP